MLNALNILLAIAWPACIIHVQYVHICVCVYTYMCVRLCVLLEHLLCDSSSVSCGFSTESLRKSYIWPVIAVIKTKRFWFLCQNNNNNSTNNYNLLYVCIYRFNICITQQFRTLIAILRIVPGSVAKLLKAPSLPLLSCNMTYIERAELQ